MKKPTLLRWALFWTGWSGACLVGAIQDRRVGAALGMAVCVLVNGAIYIREARHAE